MKTYLGIDYGTKKTGLAISLVWVAIPKWIVPTSELQRTVREMVSEYRIDEIVIGLAQNLDWSESAQSVRTREFGDALSKWFTGRTISYWTEQLTSYEAKASLEQAGVKFWQRQRPTEVRRGWKKMGAGQDPIDDMAASIMLQSFIDSNH